MALLHEDGSLIDQLINDSLGRLLLVDHSGRLTHQEGTSVVNRLVINVVRQVLKVMLDGNDTLGGQLLDIFGSVLFPVLDVRVLADTERTTLCHVSNLQRTIRL